MQNGGVDSVRSPLNLIPCLEFTIEIDLTISWIDPKRQKTVLRSTFFSGIELLVINSLIVLKRFIFFEEKNT